MARLKDKDKANDEFRRLYQRALRDHKQEFIRLLGSPPNVANVPQEFWQRVSKKIEEDSSSMMLLLFMAAATQSQVQGVPGLPLEPARDAATVYAQQRSRELATSFAKKTREAAASAFDGTPLPGKEVEARANSGRLFGDSRATGLGTTEATQAATSGGEEQIRQIETGRHPAVDQPRQIVRIWQHQGARPAGHANAPVDPCPICSPLEDRRLESLPLQFQSGPPAHPHCDCFIEYRFADRQGTNPQKQAAGII